MENKNLLPIALSYLDRGYSVICVGPDKKPLISWKEFQTRKATPDELVKWWTQNPDAQIGIVTGKISNLTVIDIESDGDFNLVKDETYTVKTGGGGRHYYFEYEKDFKNAVCVFPKTDVRSEGGYVIAAGSTSTKGSYDVLKDIKVSKMSDITRQAFLGAKKRELPWFATSGETNYPRVSTQGLDYPGSVQGGRNAAMTKFAGTIHAKLHQSLWPTIGWQIFEAANQKNNPVLSPYELQTIWNSIGNIELRNNPNGRIYSGEMKRSQTWGPEPEGESKVKIEPTFEDSLSPEISEQSADSKETLHVSEVAGLQVIDTDHTYPLDMPPFDDALLGGFTAGDLIVVAGRSGHGKTTLIQDWSVTLSSGGITNRVKLPSLWFSYEVLAKPLWQKFQGMGATEETPIYMPRFAESGDINWVIDVIEKAIAKWGVKVICIDHLGFLRAPKGNYSNAADSITHTVRALKLFAVKRGLIILMPVHVKKIGAKTPDLDDIKDSSGIYQEADTVFFIGREKDEDGLPSQQAKLWLVKNRKSGIAVSATFDYQFGRYYYNAGDNTKLLSQDSVQDPDEAAALKSYNYYNNND